MFFNKNNNNKDKDDKETSEDEEKNKKIFELIESNKVGIVIGEDHGELSGIKFLIDNAEKLFELGIRRIFVERIKEDSSFNKKYSDEVGRLLMTCQGEINSADNNLQRPSYKQDYSCSYRSDFIKTYNSKYNFPELIKKMKSCGINIMGIDPSEDKINEKFSNENLLKKLDNQYIKNLIEMLGGVYDKEKVKKHIEESKDIYKSYVLRGKYTAIKNKIMLDNISATIQKETNKNEKFIVFVGYNHAGNYISIDGDRVEGLGKKLNIPSIYICEDVLNSIDLSGYSKTLGLDEFLSGFDNHESNAENKEEKIYKEVFIQSFSSCENKKTKEGTEIDYFLSIKVTSGDDKVDTNKYYQHIVISKTNDPIAEFSENIENNNNTDYDNKINYLDTNKNTEDPKEQDMNQHLNNNNQPRLEFNPPLPLGNNHAGMFGGNNQNTNNDNNSSGQAEVWPRFM